jgi:uncharacterized repeat protein (TIGR01451 family)
LLAVATTAIAARGGVPLLPALPHLSLSPRQPIAGHVPVVRADVVRAFVRGDDVARLLVATGASTSGVGVGVDEVAVRAHTSSAPPRQAATPAVAPTDGPRPAAQKGTVASARAPGDWDARPTMGASRTEAHPGDEVTYIVQVTNVGSAPYTGDLLVTSHVPFGTTAYRPARCDQPWVPTASSHCNEIGVPVPGSPAAAGTHEINTDAVNITIPPGGSWTYEFVVVIDAATPRGTKLQNHAHVQAGDSRLQDTSPIVVVVA